MILENSALVTAQPGMSPNYTAVSSGASSLSPGNLDLVVSSGLSKVLYPKMADAPIEPFGFGMRINPFAMRVDAFYPAPLGEDTVYVRLKEDGSISLYRLLISRK